MPQRLAFNGGQWSQYEGMIRDYATNNCTKDDGTLYFLNRTSFVNRDPDTDRYDINGPSEGPKLFNEDPP